MDWTDHGRGADWCGWTGERSSSSRVQWTIRVGFGDPAFPTILSVVPVEYSQQPCKCYTLQE
ncbi:hypothetical protein QBC32DRAFT_269794 [Pseudoneurospora amorphoporcata]|uniref:Uncharacterized protein n=1 Tax=Pseudoneurospora amorphoporcata TaxID=241081 RepID=A0AAN6NN74_9PEZI|nr:hypothetical protein QBC32DRAFT_269794 [Pseudoneurospora amorphoporcata]